jgi:proline iminopeptidase
MDRVAVLGVLIAAVACGGDRKPGKQIATGEARLAVLGGSIWYKISGSGSGTPLVLLHGGPGFSSYYLKPFDDLGDDRQIVRYDQLGGGKSDTTSDTALFTIDHFVRELDSLRAHLGVATWHVLGHSWGTILALEYYRAHPDRVASLTFGSPVFDIPAFERHARQLVTTLSDSAQRAIRTAEAAGRYDSPAYQNAINEFYALYVFRHPVPADLDSTFASFNQGIYNYMQGPSEFTITGTLKRYDATPLLPQIAVPTLVTVGEFDEVGSELVRGHAAAIPGARFAILAGSAHITSWDARDDNVRAVREFLRAVDSTRAKP